MHSAKFKSKRACETGRVKEGHVEGEKKPVAVGQKDEYQECALGQGAESYEEQLEKVEEPEKQVQLLFLSEVLQEIH